MLLFNSSNVSKANMNVSPQFLNTPTALKFGLSNLACYGSSTNFLKLTHPDLGFS